jgi:hypothetical protein
MDDGNTEPRLVVQVRDVQPGTADFEEVLALAALVLAQDRYLVLSTVDGRTQPGGRARRLGWLAAAVEW